MARFARSLTWPDPDDVEKWKPIIVEIMGAEKWRGDIEEDFVYDMRNRVCDRGLPITEKQAKWLWDIYGRM